MNTNAKIVIIGAGASGITAATKLLSYGFKNVLILEAQDRIGGRIYTVPFGDNFIDLGAQWCHGEKDNIVYELVKDKNYLDSTENIYDDYDCIRSDGEVLSETTSNKLKEILEEYLDSKKEDLPTFEGSLASYLREKFLKTSELPRYSDLDRDLVEEFLNYYHKFEVSMECCDSLFDVSGKGHLDYWNCEGDIGLNWKDKGFVMLLRTLLQTDGLDFGVMNKRILLRKEVTNISWDKSGLKPLIITTACGLTFEADHVICTVSLAVLKEGFKSKFTPSLPERKLKAIQGLGIGTVNKVFIHFEKRWWNEDWCGFSILWKKEDLEELRQSKFFWLEDVFGFYAVKYQPNILSSWVTGSSAKYVETLSKSEQMEGIMFLMKKFLKREIPQPIDFIITSWHSNPFIRGSYSHRSMETEHLTTGSWDLAEPVLSPNGRPILQFAGEATHNHYYSTVHGAVETGVREAERLNQFYCDKKKSHL
ncbi:hypothetical protein ACFFRR_004298 [Megaselia abdita]